MTLELKRLRKVFKTKCNEHFFSTNKPFFSSLSSFIGSSFPGSNVTKHYGWK